MTRKINPSYNSNMGNDCILVVDSGYGGMNVLAACKEKMPEQNYLFLMDDINCPYGNKTKEIIEDIVVSLVKNEIEINPNIKMVVLACNTATACAISKLRTSINLPVVGIEPAIKRALENNVESDKILVFCTELTRKYAKSIAFAQSQAPDKLLFFCNSKLAPLIDANITHLDDLLPWLSVSLEQLKKERITKVVLGCTHYAFLQEQIETALGGQIKFYPSENATALQVQRVCESISLKGNGQLEFKSTGKTRAKKMKSVFEERFHYLFE